MAILKVMGDIKLGNCNNELGSAWECFFSLTPEQITLLSVLIGILLTECLNINQQNVLGNFLLNIGQSLATSAAQGALLEESDSKNNNVNRKILLLKKQICALEQEFNNG